MYVDEYDDSAVSAASIAGAPSTVPSSLPPTISSTTANDTSIGKCKIDMSNKSPIDFFKMPVTLDILDNIVDQTNLYAIYKIMYYIKTKETYVLFYVMWFVYVNIYKPHNYTHTHTHTHTNNNILL